jgi:hypothetical protein
MSSHIIKALGSKVPERFVTTHAAKHQRSWWPLRERTPLQAALLPTAFLLLS